MPGVAESLEKILRDVEERDPDIEAMAVISEEGLILASALPLGTDEDRIAAISSIALSLGERALSELAKGKVEEIVLKGSKGYIITFGANGYGAVTALTSKETKLGMTLFELRRAVLDVQDVLEGKEKGSEVPGTALGR